MKRVLKLLLATIISFVVWAVVVAIVSPIVEATELLSGDYVHICSAFLAILPAALMFVRVLCKKEKRKLYYLVVASSVAVLVILQIPVFLIIPAEDASAVRKVNMVLMVAVFVLAKKYIAKKEG